ncbi:hypothetical protein L6R52_14900 [Myxococcota bacterium]|nr:hypothetical protein [Myxococcota bacterium]
MCGARRLARLTVDVLSLDASTLGKVATLTRLYAEVDELEAHALASALVATAGG